MNQIEKRITAPNKSYWAETGAYQKEYSDLYKKLVPDIGEANTVHGEMLRTVSRLTYDYNNNGNCNVVDMKTHTETETHTCWECGGSGEVEDFDGEEEKTVECSECGGSGELEEDEEYDDHKEITPYWELMFDYLKSVMTNKQPIENLEAFVLDMTVGYGSYKFDEKEMTVYNTLFDEVIYQVLTTENYPRNVNKD